ncbi:MAG: helicase-related protein [Fimbriimonadales bacterium]
MSQIPDLIDNNPSRGVRLADVLVDVLCASKHPRLWVATAYFNIDGFEVLGDALEAVQELRILLGTEQHQEFVLTHRLKQELERHFALIHPESQCKVARWATFLKEDKVQVRRYKPAEHGRILHGKMYLIQGVPMPGAVGIVGSSNFTGAGLTTNLELNAVLNQDAKTSRLCQWYEELWEQAEDYKGELLQMLEQFTRPLEPYEVYIKVIYEAYRDRLAAGLSEQDGKPSPIVLADFQRDGYHAAREILEQYGGVLIADSVGLGKTYLALRLLDDYAYHQRKTALVICPAALRDTVWKPLLEQHAIPHRIESMEQLSRNQLNLGDLSQFSVIVVDESHNFRNPGANRWRNLFELVRNAKPDETRLILLTATPVNNSVYDLYHQIRLITRDDKSFFQIAGIDNLEGYFREADETRETLYELLEAISVRRSRAFIRRHYPNTEIDGKPIHFPERRIHSQKYNLQAVYGGDLYNRVANAIEQLNLAPYQLDSYRKEVVKERSYLFEEEGWKRIETALQAAGTSRERINQLRRTLAGQTALANLMRVLYLKRLESSVEALRNSLRHQREFQKKFLDALQQGKLLTSDDYRRMLIMEGDDEEETADSLNEFLNALQPIDAEQYELPLIEQAVGEDVDSLETLLQELDRLKPERDMKVAKLVRLIKQHKNEKIVLFSYYKDTARMLERELRRRLPNFEIALVDSDVRMEERKHIVQRFSPKSNRYTFSPGEREIQILIATDALSEGQNLQDARIVINYDLHWNPVRMVQRIGRIDRIGSPHECIEVYNFIPEDALENLLGLMERLRQKLQQINQAVGLDASVLGETPNPQDFNTLRRIAKDDSSVLDELESESELNIGEFLMEDLMAFLKKLGEESLERIPLGRGTAKRAQSPEQRGFFAAFRNTRTEQHYWLFQYNDGRLKTAQLRAIRAIRAKPGEQPAPLPDAQATEQKLRELRDELVKRLNLQAHRLQELPKVQRQIVQRLNILPSSATRNELLTYFKRPLPEVDLRALRDVWKQAQREAPHQMLQRLKAFAEAHPHPPVNAPQQQAITADDLECVAWMWLV